MGLDLVEFVMAVEDTFDLAIPNEAAAQLRTPGDVIDYVHSQLPAASSGGCLSQRAFYKVRRATSEKLAVSRSSIRPTAPLAPLFGVPESPAWVALRGEIGSPHWPRIGRRWSGNPLRPNLQTFGELAAFLVERAPATVKEGDPKWSRAQVADVVRRLIRSELGVTKPYTETSSFVEDLGID